MSFFGDLLITGPTPSDTPVVTVPAQGEVQNFFGDSGWGIRGLKQKVNIVSDNCAIAWAGSWLNARLVISSLRRLSESRELTSADIIDAIDDLGADEESVQFVGLLNEGGERFAFHSNAEEVTSMVLGDTYVAGTGGDTIRQFERLLGDVKYVEERNVNSGTKAVAKSLLLGGLLLHSEWRGGLAASTLLNAFGGGYEFAFFENGRMQKLPEVTFMFWEARLNAEGCGIFLPLFIVKQAYIDEHLLIRSVRLKATGGLEARTLDEQHLMIKPMFDTANRPSEETLRSLPLVSNLLCHCIQVNDGSSYIGFTSYLQGYSATSVNEVSFHADGEDWEVSFHSSLLDNLARLVKQVKA